MPQGAGVSISFVCWTSLFHCWAYFISTTRYHGGGGLFICTQVRALKLRCTLGTAILFFVDLNKI